MYSITIAHSFLEVKELYESILRVKDSNRIACVLAGNKADLAEFREVQTADAKSFADANKVPFFETSAKEFVRVCACSCACSCACGVRAVFVRCSCGVRVRARAGADACADA